MRATVTKVVFYAAPVFTLIGGLITAAVLMAIFNFMLGAEVSFQRSMAVVFYAGCRGLLRAILLTVSVLASSDRPPIDLARTIPCRQILGSFMDPQGNKFIYTHRFELWTIFNIW